MDSSTICILPLEVVKSQKLKRRGARDGETYENLSPRLSVFPTLRLLEMLGCRNQGDSIERGGTNHR